MRSLLYFFCLSLVSTVLFTCEESVDTDKVQFGYEYFPLEVGQYRIYEVDSIVYDPIGGGTVIDSTKTFFREIIADTLIDNTGATVFRVERYQRKNNDLPWNIQKVLILSRDESRAFWIEDNLRFIKMVFPVEAGKSWDGHVFFDPTLIVPVAGESIELFKDWSYQIRAVNQPIQIGDFVFNEVVTISNADSENLIELRQSTEQYAKGVGLISRELFILDTQCNDCCGQDFAACSNIAWEEKAEKGFILRQKIIDHN